MKTQLATRPACIALVLVTAVFGTPFLAAAADQAAPPAPPASLAPPASSAPPASPAPSAPPAQVPKSPPMAPMGGPQGEGSPGGMMPGMGMMNSQMMQQHGADMQTHMKNMETHMANIESLLRELVAQGKGK